MSSRAFSGTVSRTVMAIEYGSSPVDEAAHSRVTCPRCGEAVPVPALNGDYVAPAVTATVAAPSSVSHQRRNRLFGVGVIAGMLILAAVVALLLINTRGKRRLTTLAESEAVGYLPDDTNVIIALNPAEADRTKEGKETLDIWSGMMWKFERSGMMTPATTGRSALAMPSQSVAQNVQS